MNKKETAGAMRGWAQLLYTHHNHTIPEVCVATGATEAMVRNWVQEGNWDGLRRSITVTRQTQLTLLYDILHAHIVKVKAHAEDEHAEGNSKDADLLIKYTAAIKNLEKETSIREIVDVAKLFTTWLMKHNLELAKTVNREFDDFINERLATTFE